MHTTWCKYEGVHNNKFGFYGLPNGLRIKRFPARKLVSMKLLEQMHMSRSRLARSRKHSRQNLVIEYFEDTIQPYTNLLAT